jgi:hypothetical protein
MGILSKDEIEKDSNPSLLVRLSAITKIPNHHNADQAARLRDEWRSTLTKAEVSAWRKRVKLFLKQNEVRLERDL